jgi:hypothetical protein
MEISLYFFELRSEELFYLVSVPMVDKITDFEELQCRKLAIRLYYDMSEHAKKSDRDAEDELVCRWLVSSLHISGKIAFAFGAEDHAWFLEWLPLARKYCFESAFRTRVMEKKKMISKSKAQDYQVVIKRILKKIILVFRKTIFFQTNEFS